MLSEEFITAVLGLEDFYLLDGEVKEDGSVEIEVAPKWDVALCSQCQRASGSVVEYLPRWMRDLSMSGRPVYVVFEQRRFRCAYGRISFVERQASASCPKSLSQSSPYSFRS